MYNGIVWIWLLLFLLLGSSFGIFDLRCCWRLRRTQGRVIECSKVKPGTPSDGAADLGGGVERGWTSRRGGGCVTAAKNRAICNVNARERERGQRLDGSHGASHCEWAVSHHVTEDVRSRCDRPHSRTRQSFLAESTSCSVKGLYTEIWRKWVKTLKQTLFFYGFYKCFVLTLFVNIPND